MEKLTSELLPGDLLVWSDHADEVISVDLPEPPAVVAKVLVTRRLAHNGQEVSTFFYSGVNAVHQVIRQA
jgi:hypothetical protein